MDPETDQGSEGTRFEVGRLDRNQGMLESFHPVRPGTWGGFADGSPAIAPPPPTMATTPNTRIFPQDHPQVARGPCGFSVFVSIAVVHRNQLQRVGHCPSGNSAISWGLVLSSGANHSLPASLTNIGRDHASLTQCLLSSLAFLTLTLIFLTRGQGHFPHRHLEE